MTPAAVHRRPACLECSLCGRAPEVRATKRKRASVSSLEVEVDAAIRAAAPGCAVITQAHTIPGFKGGVDFTVRLPSGRELDVEVDGEQHFGNGHHDTSAAEQEARDERKDSLSLDAGRHRVRLHWDDMRGWVPRLRGALKLVAGGRCAAFNGYTHSYGKPDVELTDAQLAARRALARAVPVGEAV